VLTKGESTKQAILDRALFIASTDGLEGLSIGGLARDVGMSKSGLFAHFHSKEQLQLDTLRHAVERFVGKVIAPALKAPRGEARLRALFDHWLLWERDEFPGGCVVQTAIVEFDDREGPVRSFLLESWRDLVDTVTNILRAGISVGAFRADLDVELCAFELMNIVSGYRRHWRFFRDSDAELLARASLAALLRRARL
jgi:AcrR family transcriptional regulator